MVTAGLCRSWNSSQAPNTAPSPLLPLSLKTSQGVPFPVAGGAQLLPPLPPGRARLDTCAFSPWRSALPRWSPVFRPVPLPHPPSWSRKGRGSFSHPSPPPWELNSILLYHPLNIPPPSLVTPGGQGSASTGPPHPASVACGVIWGPSPASFIQDHGTCRDLHLGLPTVILARALGSDGLDTERQLHYLPAVILS